MNPYHKALGKIILAAAGFAVGMLVLLFIAIFSGLVPVFIMPLLAIPLGLGFALWLIRSGTFREFREAAIKNALNQPHVKEMQREAIKQAFEQGPAREALKDALKEIEIEKTAKSEQQDNKANL